MIEILSGPWPWYVAGPLIGLTVPALLILGNKIFGISSSLRHICAACLPANIPFFKYNWKKELWNLFFVLGIFIGGLISYLFLKNPNPIELNPQLVNELKQYGINDFNSLVPTDLFSLDNLLSLKGFFLMVVGGFMVGFGTRYAGGCTSGHSIMGLSLLQLSSLIATICFMLGGIVAANFLLPVLLNL
jgi:uncharacterized membrane protein YedE/YeeE